MPSLLELYSMYSLFYSHLWEFKTLWLLTHAVYGQSTKETIQGLKVELLVLFLCQFLATIQKILVFQHTYQVIYHLKLPVFNPWIKLPKQATGLNLIIKLNVFIFISCSRGYFYLKLVKLLCKGNHAVTLWILVLVLRQSERLFHHCHFSPDYFKLFCSWGVIWVSYRNIWGACHCC